MTPDSVASAYCFLHQKWRVYERSPMEWQRDDIERAVEDYAAAMSPALYRVIGEGRTDFLRDHVSFARDMARALTRLEAMLAG